MIVQAVLSKRVDKQLTAEEKRFPQRALRMTDYELTQTVIGCAMKVHSALGPGLLESAYQECLCFELSSAGLFAEKEKPMPLVYCDVKLDCGYRVNIMVERRLILEIKAVEAINDVHLAPSSHVPRSWRTLRLGLILEL